MNDEAETNDAGRDDATWFDASRVFRLLTVNKGA